MRDVITIGSATIDAFLETNLEMIDYPRIPMRKAIVIPFGEKVSARNLVMTEGGNAMNAAVTFRRQGLKTAACLKIGDDGNGVSVLDRMKTERVENSLVSIDKGTTTSFSVIFLEKGERSIVNFKGAGGELSSAEVPMNKMKARWWYVSLPGKSISLLPSLVEHARKNNIRIAFNPSGWHISHAKNQLIKSLKKIDFVVMNEGEAAELTGIPFSREKEVFRKIDEIVPGICAITSGERGASVSDGSYIYKAGIFRERKLIDRTGAGDAFGAGFVAGLIHRDEECEKGDIDPDNITYALRLATANAASVIEKIGGSEGSLTRKEFVKEKRWSRLKIVKTEII